MKMVKSLLLGSVAGVAAITGAQAADLPLAEPVEYVRICDTWGAGYFYIPGTQTCLQISGLVRSNLYYTEQFTRGADAVFFRNRARLNFDARTQTEMGTLRSYIRLQGDWSNNSSQNSTPFGGVAAGVTGIYAEKAFIQFAGFTAGLSQSFFDSNFSGSYLHLFSSDTTNNVIGYTATFGSGFSATIAVEDRSGREAVAGGVFGPVGAPIVYAGTTMPDVVANVAVNQAWGSFQLSGAVHQNRDIDPDVDTEYGFAVQASGAVNLPFMAKGTRLFLTAAYADAALAYLGSVASPFAGALGLGFADSYVVGTSLSQSSGFAISGGGSFFFSPTLRSHITVGYADIDADTTDVLGIAVNDYSQLTAAANIVYSPVANLDLGLEVFYQGISDDSVVFPATIDDNRFGAIARVERRF
jgi:hypothetical protein